MGIGLGVGLGFSMGVGLAINHIRVNCRKVCVRRKVAKVSYLDYCCRNRMLTYMKAYLTVSIRLRTQHTRLSLAQALGQQLVWEMVWEMVWKSVWESVWESAWESK